LTESDFQFDVKLSRWRPWCHFTQKSAAIWRVHTQRLFGTCAAASASSWSI